MPELRTDPLTGDRVVVAPARAKRPGAWNGPGGSNGPGGRNASEDRGPPGRENCPFCEGHETETPPEIFAIADARRQPDAPGWRIRVVPNKFPAFGPHEPRSANGVFVAEAATGAQDVVIHTPEHVETVAELSPAALEDIAAAWRWRATDGSPPGTEYVHAAVNEGREAGASLAHSHSQLFSLAFVPPRVSAEIERQEQADGCIA